MSDEIGHLRRCLDLAWAARHRGDQPFGSILVSGAGRVLAEAENTEITERDCTGHPELVLARWACRHMDEADRAAATMYTSGEHCAMCAAAFFWSGLGRLVFALSGAELTGLQRQAGSRQPSLALSTRDVFARATRPDGRLPEVIGPVPELAAEARAVHDGYWLPPTGEPGTS